MLRSTGFGAGVLAVSVALALGRCGSDSSSTSGHATPEGAARGFADALQGYDGSQPTIDRILDWITPNGRSAFRQFLPASSSGLTIHYEVKNFGVTGVTTGSTTADVAVSGELDVCGAGTVVGQQLNTCSPATGAFGNGSGNCLQTAQVQGQWYVSGLCSPAPSTNRPGGAGGGTTTSSS